MKFTHFFSIPANTDDIIENYNKFKDNLLRNCEDFAPGLKEGMFSEAEKLHITVTMLLLLDDDDKQKAIDALHSFKKDII